MAARKVHAVPCEEGSSVRIERISNGYLSRSYHPKTMKEHVVYHEKNPLDTNKLKPVKSVAKAKPIKRGRF